MRKQSQHNNDERTQFFRKLYLSHLRKGYVWEISWRLNKSATYWPPSGYSSTSFSFCWAAQQGALRASDPQSRAGSHAGILSPKLWLQLTKLPVTSGYIIVWRPPASCGCHICTQNKPVYSQGYPLISSTAWTCYLHRCISYLTAQLGRGSICYISWTNFY